jgi:VIT1/CCC1 family predicted Fe2+/Mn2+ transporter
VVTITELFGWRQHRCRLKPGQPWVDSRADMEGSAMRHRETHRTHRVGWLRAAVLGANDGIVSTASLVLGVAAAEAGRAGVLTAGVAGLVAGAMSMAAGEYVSVSSQKDTEDADLQREGGELEQNPKHEHEELARIYVERGVDPETASRVAEQMMAHDALGAHARDELGISDVSSARPVQAAFASAGTFSIGAAMPLAVAALVPGGAVIPAVAGTSLGFLAFLGGLAARAGGAGVLVGATRVTVWGALAMGITMAVGRLFGAIL